VYCFPRFSSRWASELNIQQTAPTEEQRNNFKNYIFDHVGQLKHVYLAGGEPLLMKENVELLQQLLKTNPEVNLRINSNLSKTDTGVFDLVCQFKNAHWTVSVETIEEEYNYVRYGGRWEDFLDNLNIINKLNHRISFNMLYFLLNYKSLFGCVEYFQRMGFHNNSFIIGGIITPEYLNVRNLPAQTIDEVKLEFAHRINQRPGFLLENSYRNILSYLDEPWKKDLTNSFAELYKMDQRRNLDSSQIFKDLYAFKR
jgi:sulfatase maturation enzyme AslB (radical SAM superfamily)